MKLTRAQREELGYLACFEANGRELHPCAVPAAEIRVHPGGDFVTRLNGSTAKALQKKGLVETRCPLFKGMPAMGPPVERLTVEGREVAEEVGRYCSKGACPLAKTKGIE